MALIQCPECNKQVSDSAKTCPHCGYKLNVQQVKYRNTIILGIIVSVIVVGLLVFISFERAKEKQAQEAFYEYVNESTRPSSYQDARYAIVGTHPYWELSENNDAAGASIILNFKLDEDEKNGIPFRESYVYQNWDSFFRRKSK